MNESSFLFFFTYVLSVAALDYYNGNDYSYIHTKKEVPDKGVLFFDKDPFSD